MANLNAKNFSLNVARDIEKLLKLLRVLYSQNSNLIEILETDQIFYLKDKSHNDFYFFISGHERDVVQKKTSFCISYAPENSESSGGTSIYSDLEGITECFNDWITIIKDFNSVNFSEEQILLKFYEDEFYDEFEIIEEDTSHNPFENPQQIYLYKFLEYISNELKSGQNDDPILLEIISDTNDLKDNLQNLSKKTIIRKMSAIFARIKKFSLKLSMDIFDVAKKEVIKKCLYGGFDEINYFIDKL